MTKIVNIGELYKLIPETKKLEGVNFTNLRHLLSSVIKTVEESGVYEFVQYIQGNPSFFVVRDKPVRSDNRLTNASLLRTQKADSYSTGIERNSGTKQAKPITPLDEYADKTGKDDKISDEAVKTPTVEETEFPTTKLPWS